MKKTCIFFLWNRLYNCTSSPKLEKVEGGGRFGFGGQGMAKVVNSGRFRTVFAAPFLQIPTCGPQIFDINPSFAFNLTVSDTYERFPKLNFGKNRETGSNSKNSTNP